MNLNNIIQYNPEWFDLAVLPSGIDKQILKETIIFRCGLLTPVYGQPDLFQKFVGHWFAKQYNNIEKLISLYAAEYDPLRNYDRTEELHREYEDNGQDQDKLTHGKQTTNNLTQTDNHTQTNNLTRTDNLTEGHTGHDDTERTTSAMNEITYQPDNKEVLTHGESITNTGTETNTGTIGNSGTVTNTGTITDSGIDTTDRKIDHDGFEDHENHVYGNIGVTTSQQMWIQENELLRDHNIYDEIARLFESEMMLGVY